MKNKSILNDLPLVDVSEHTYKRKKREEVFAIKGFYVNSRNLTPDQKTLNEKILKGSFEMGGVRYNYKINGFKVFFSTGDNPLENTMVDLLEGFWLVINEDFMENNYPFALIYDEEFDKVYGKTEN